MPTSWPLSTSRAGSLAIASISSMETTSPSMVPPLKASTSCSLRKVAMALAARAASPFTKVKAVGPSSSSLSDSAPALSAASWVSVFFTIRSVASASFSFSRSSAAWGTLRPR